LTPETRFGFRNPMYSTRRSVLHCLLAAPALAAQTEATSIVMRLTDRKLLHIEDAGFAAAAVLPPASTIKPFALLALMEARKLRPDDQFVCSRHLQINGHLLNCIHPETPVPMNAARAIAYSCNAAVAHFAARFAMDELPQALTRYGFKSQTGLLPQEANGTLQGNTFGASCELQALGEEGIAVTPLELLLAYARLSHRLTDSRYAAIREGLEGAVEFGTAQAAKIPSAQVAGKTGSIVLRSGSPGAWFAGFAPSRTPRIAVVVFTPGHSGGADAAPIAAKLLKRYL
jgi:cell division protein FtsI/penicillin-binding protein 2